MMRRSALGAAVTLIAVLGSGWNAAPEGSANGAVPEDNVEDAGAVAPLRLVLNLPAYRLDVYEFGERTRTYPVAVGKPTHRTPRGEYRLSHVEWNPWWHPPNSPWARGASAAPPGPSNPMGRAKLFFRNLYYLHGTPAESSLGSAASHGCVRLSNRDVIELARLVHQYASPEVSGTQLDRIESNSRSTRTIRLRSPVALEIRYDLVEARNGLLHVHRDIYALGSRALVREQVMQSMIRLGHDPVEVSGARVEALWRDAQTGSVSVPIESLLLGEPAGGTIR